MSSPKCNLLMYKYVCGNFRNISRDPEHTLTRLFFIDCKPHTESWLLIDQCVCDWFSCITACGSILLHYCSEIRQKLSTAEQPENHSVAHSYLIAHRSAQHIIPARPISRMNLLLLPFCHGESGLFLLWGMERSKNFTWNWSLSRQSLILSGDGLIIRSNFITAGRNLCEWTPSRGSLCRDTSWDDEMSSGWTTPTLTPTFLFFFFFFFLIRGSFYQLRLLHLFRKRHVPIRANHLFWPPRPFSCRRLSRSFPRCRMKRWHSCLYHRVQTASAPSAASPSKPLRHASPRRKPASPKERRKNAEKRMSSNPAVTWRRANRSHFCTGMFLKAWCLYPWKTWIPTTITRK